MILLAKLKPDIRQPFSLGPISHLLHQTSHVQEKSKKHLIMPWYDLLQRPQHLTFEVVLPCQLLPYHHPVKVNDNNGELHGGIGMLKFMEIELVKAKTRMQCTIPCPPAQCPLRITYSALEHRRKCKGGW